MNSYHILRSLLYKLDPELAHQLTINLLQFAGNISLIRKLLQRIYSAPGPPVQAFGLSFSHPIGLAAGYDKDGLAWRGLACLGFSHVEIGTVTPKPQSGNPRPRLFRLQQDYALINRMGFPGFGSEFVLKQINRQRPTNLVLGVNIGKNKDTPLENAADDYTYLLRLFARTADYLSINISSPNTIGLRRLQERQALNELLGQLHAERENFDPSMDHKVPLLVKLSPDLSDPELDDALEVILSNHLDGVIATNTTISRDGIKSTLAQEVGGLSGKPLLLKSLEMVGKIAKRTGGKLPIIGVGGIFDATGARRMLDAGAVLVQIYTGLIYEGPGLIKQILKDFQ